MRSKTAGRGKACPKDPSHCSGYCLCVERIRLNSNSPKTAHCIDAPSSTSEIRAAARHTIEGGYHYLSSCFDGLGGAEHPSRTATYGSRVRTTIVVSNPSRGTDPSDFRRSTLGPVIPIRVIDVITYRQPPPTRRNQ